MSFRDEDKELYTISRINYWKDKFNKLKVTNMSTEQFKINFNLNYKDLYFDEIAEESLLFEYELQVKNKNNIKP